VVGGGGGVKGAPVFILWGGGGGVQARLVRMHLP